MDHLNKEMLFFGGATLLMCGGQFVMEKLTMIVKCKDRVSEQVFLIRNIF